MIIGILGQAGSGKDTVADLLVKKYGFIKVALADPLKRICKEVYSFSDEQLWGPSENRNAPDLRYPTGRGHLSPRVALQTLGTEWGRVQYEDTWIDYGLMLSKRLLGGGYTYSAKRGLSGASLFKRVLGVKPQGVVIPDVRFKNELKKIRQAKGWVIRIKRGSATGNVGVAGHPSEEEQKTILDHEFDDIIDNNLSLQNLHSEIDRVFLNLSIRSSR